MLKYSFASTSGTTTQNLLVYKGGFLVFKQKKGRPCYTGEFQLYDGIGRIHHTYGSKGNEFKVDITDWGIARKTWYAKSGKPLENDPTLEPDPHDGEQRYGADYDRPDERGHIPPGWWLVLTYRIDGLTGRQNDYNRTVAGKTRLLQGNYRRWLVDDLATGGYTVRYRYDATLSHDLSIGKPVTQPSLAYKADLREILPTSAYNRSGIQIHPDGRKNGTAGCIGILSVPHVQEVSYILRNYHGLKVKCILVD